MNTDPRWRGLSPPGRCGRERPITRMAGAGQEPRSGLEVFARFSSHRDASWFGFDPGCTLGNLCRTNGPSCSRRLAASGVASGVRASAKAHWK
jgi:hypothetical protein